MPTAQSIINGEQITVPKVTQQLGDQGYVPVATPIPAPDTSKLTADNLNQTSPIPYATPNEVPAYPVAMLNNYGIDANGMATETSTEKQASELSKRLQGLNDQYTGQSAYRADQEAAMGLPGLIKTQNDLSSQLKAIQNEAQAIPLQLQQEATGKGITVGGLRPIETARVRTNAIQALGVSSLLEASRGNIATATTLVDRAVAQRFDPIKEQIDATTKNLELILKSPEYSREDKNRAQAQLDYQNEKKRLIDKQAADTKDIMSTATEAAKNGADALTLKKIQSATSPAEALQIAAPYMAAQFNQDKAQQSFDNALQTAQLSLQEKELVNKLKQQAFDNNQTLAEFQLKREMFASDAKFKEAQQLIDKIKASGAGDAPVVKEINGVTKQWNNQTGKWEDLATPEDPQAAQRSLDQIKLVKDTLDKTEKLSHKSGSNTMWERAKQGVFGSTDYTNLVALTNTLRTNVMTMMTDPAIKKFFGPQMSNADVQLMTSAGTTLNPELQSPEAMKSELNRLKDFIQRAESAVKQGGGGGQKGFTKDGKSKADLKAEFPQASDAEIDQLFKEEGGFSMVGGDTNKALKYSSGATGGQCGVFINKTAGIRVGQGKEDKMANVDKYGNHGTAGIAAGDVIIQGIGKYGHVALVTKVNPDGSVEVTESNYNQDEKVTHGRLVKPERIYGYIRPNRATALSIKNNNLA